MKVNNYTKYKKALDMMVMLISMMNDALIAKREFSSFSFLYKNFLL